ncbi:MAG TPA: cell division protein FtsA [Taishania sp.]|nr:cell division protein FtsA [Taishania sp.]
MSKVVVGLDIGTTKIACFVGQRNEYGKIEILAIGQKESLGVNRGVVENIEKTIQSIKGAIEDAKEYIEQQKDGVEITLRSVYVGVAGQHIKSMQHRGMLVRTNVENEISQKDLDILEDDMYRMLMPPGEQIIKVIPKQYDIDGHQGIKDPIGHAGVKIEANFHMITGNVGACTNIVRCVTRAGYHVQDMVLEPMASAEAVLSEEEKEAGVAILDIGGGRYAFYAHCVPNSFMVEIGDVVKEGDPIGLLGNSGNSDAPHLHFHIMDGTDIFFSNGLPFVVKKYTKVGDFETGPTTPTIVTNSMMEEYSIINFE